VLKLLTAKSFGEEISVIELFVPETKLFFAPLHSGVISAIFLFT